MTALARLNQITEELEGAMVNVLRVEVDGSKRGRELLPDKAPSNLGETVILRDPTGHHLDEVIAERKPPAHVPVAAAIAERTRTIKDATELANEIVNRILTLKDRLEA